jgi:hypothetical protein
MPHFGTSGWRTGASRAPLYLAPLIVERSSPPSRRKRRRRPPRMLPAPRRRRHLGPQRIGKGRFCQFSSFTWTWRRLRDSLTCEYRNCNV